MSEHRPKLLIVEDDPIVRRIYVQKFALQGFETTSAGDGETALKEATTSPPDILLLDLMLPGMNGVELLQKLRAEPRTAELPVVVFSNSYLSSMVESAWKAGATKCLSKLDCTPNQLIDVVRSTLAIYNKKQSHPEEAVAAPNLKAEFERGIPELVRKLRQNSLSFLRADDSAKASVLTDLIRIVHSVTSNATVARFTRISGLASTFEALLEELRSKPNLISSSTVRTITQATDLLVLLLETKHDSQEDQGPPPLLMVVDDEAVSRKVLASALERMNMRTIALETPASALEVLKHNKVDVIFSDIQMPDMDGFKFAEAVRKLGHDTPIVFVTVLSDFQSRAKSLMSGGQDLMAKPFVHLEVGLKALTCLLKTKQPVPTQSTQ